MSQYKKDIRNLKEKIKSQQISINKLTLDFLCERHNVERETMEFEDARSAQFRSELRYEEYKVTAAVWYDSYVNNE